MVAAAAFQQFGSEHVVLLGIFALGCIAAGMLGGRVRGRAAELPLRRGFAVLIPVVTVPLQVLQFLPGDFDLGTSLPFQLCDLSWIVAVWALWSRSRRAAALLYYWGLTLTVQAIATPSLGEDFPDPRFFMYFGMHFLTVWAAVFVAFGLRIGPDWRRYRFAAACTAVWAAAVMAFNAATGTNYGYLARKPSAGSLLDLFGPWPVYVVVEVAVVLAGWALITWPWTRRAAVPAARTGDCRQPPPGT